MPPPELLRRNPNYRPSQQPGKIYSGPSIPSAYDPNWQYFTNLTPQQIAWFQAQPEWQNFLSYVALSPATAEAATPVEVVNRVLQDVGKPVVTKPLPLKVG